VSTATLSTTVESTQHVSHAVESVEVDSAPFEQADIAATAAIAIAKNTFFIFVFIFVLIVLYKYIKIFLNIQI